MRPLALALLAAAALAGPAAAARRAQPNSLFAASFAAARVANVSATSQRVSCYTPSVPPSGGLGPEAGYPDGGPSTCDGGATTGEDVGPFEGQQARNAPLRVKDYAESDLRVDPRNPRHLIGQSKWAVGAEGYNHLIGFYESFDGGISWPVQGHVPGYEAWTDNSDPVGAFDPWGNFYALVLAYKFTYDDEGRHRSGRAVNPQLPDSALAVSIHPARAVAGKAPAASWLTRRGGRPDYVTTSADQSSRFLDKQWLAIDTGARSRYRGRIYAMWAEYSGPSVSVIVESHADARPNGTHTAWSPPRLLPRRPIPETTILLPHVAPDGTVWTTTTAIDRGRAEIDLVWSRDGGRTWLGPRRVATGLELLGRYANTTFRAGAPDSFAVGPRKVGRFYPLYVAYESGRPSTLWLTASYDEGRTWTRPVQIADNGAATDEFQPAVDVAPNGTVAVAFYDRRLACPRETDADASGSGIAFDPLRPWGATNYCVNTAIQFYRPRLRPVGPNVRLSQHTWDPQLSAYHPSCACDPLTFIGDYFGLVSAGGFTYTSSVSTFDYGDENPFFHQQQVLARIPTP